jgi:hypothetical protein
MIDPKTLTTEWLNAVSAKNRKADKILVEKVIRALLLLEGLVKAKIDFVFKGGTALMLLTGSTKRLSIDIDIIISKPQELEPLFKGFIEEQGFTRFELQERRANSKIEKAHYKFFYKPIHQYGLAEDYVLLDILFEEPHYKQIIEWPIDSTFLIQDGEPIKVRIPSYEDILGDKLTAFAPNTTGVPYEKNGDSRAMEIIKQLYDIGSLMAFVKAPAIVAQTFYIFAETELGYRELETDIAPVLEDIYQTALHICSRGTEGKGDIKALLRGISQVSRFIFSESYHLERAITDAAKAAYLSKAIQYKIEAFETYSNPAQVTDFVIDQSFNSKLNKLKKSNPEAFFYWYQVSLLEK